MYILVIEDDKLLTDLICQKLSKEKFETKVAIDAQEGLKAMEEKRPDLILLDLILPGSDGFEFLTLLRKHPKLSSVPVIVLSNLSTQEDIERALALEVKDFLIKADLGLSGIVEKVKSAL